MSAKYCNDKNVSIMHFTFHTIKGRSAFKFQKVESSCNICMRYVVCKIKKLLHISYHETSHGQRGPGKLYRPRSALRIA